MATASLSVDLLQACEAVAVVKSVAAAEDTGDWLAAATARARLDSDGDGSMNTAWTPPLDSDGDASMTAKDVSTSPPLSASHSAPAAVAARSRSPRRPVAVAPARRSGETQVDFRLRFTQILAAKSFFNNISMLEEAYLTVCRDAGPTRFSGLMADAVDSTRVALVQGRLGAIVDLNVEDAAFCVKIKSVLDCLATAHTQHFLDIYRLRGSTDITIRVHEPGCSRVLSKYEIKTLARENETIPLDEMIMSYYVEIELEAFRAALKMAKTKKACGIQFRLYEAPVTGDATQCMWFVLSYEGEDTRGTHPFLSRVVTESGVDGEPIIVRVASSDIEDELYDGDEKINEEDFAQYLLLYSGDFAVDYLNNFVRNMEKVNVTLRLKNGNPLILDYPLGSVTTDSLRYVLAARMCD